MTSVMTVSVVIPTRDRPALLHDAVESILAGERLPDEIVVADQSSPPRPTLPVSGDVAIVHLELTSTGVSRARNAAIAKACGNLIVCTDDDVRVDRAWLGMIVDAFDQRAARTVVTGAVLSGVDGDDHVPSLTYRTRPETFRGRVFCDPVAGLNVAFPRTAVDEIGPFDERLGPGSRFDNAEDNDFGYRLLEAGYEIAFVPEAIVYHRGVRRGRALARLDYSYGRGQGAFYAKHLRWSDRHMLRRMGRNIAYRVRRLPPALRGDRRALGEAIYLAGLISGAVGWMRRYGVRS
jgi:GT2 family glycosyltransferase